MSPVVILFSLGVWWILWGIVGAMLAVPLTSILRLIASDLMQNNEAGYCARPLTFSRARVAHVG